MMRTLKLSLVLGSSLVSLAALAQDNVPPAAPVNNGAAPAATAGGADAPQNPSAPPSTDNKKKTGGPGLSLAPEAPQVGGLVVSPAEPVTAEEPATGEWKFDVTGYFRAPMRMSWGPSTTTDPTGDAGTQLRTPPLVPDANYIDWRYTNSLVGPWTELNFHYGNDRVKATVQIASYNLTDPGYRRLEANLGINQAFLTMSWPELFNLEDLHLTVTAGGFTNRYGAAGRYDAGKYETYLFGRTHTAGITENLAYDVGDWTLQVEHGFGAKLEPIPFYGPPGTQGLPNTSLPAWNPYPGPFAQESTFVHHAHLGAVFKRQLLLGAHYIDVFANDNERSTAYTTPMMTFNVTGGGRASSDPRPHIVIAGADAKLLGGVLGDGYIGYSHIEATKAQFLADAIEVLHSFGGWQLHDNFFGPAGGTEDSTGKIDSVEFQYVFSFGQLFHYPQAFWGDGPDIITSVFAMYNKVSEAANAAYNISKLKLGAELTYIPLPWLGLGGRYDLVQPNLDDSTQTFSVISPRLIFRTAFVTHEQLLFQYSHYFYGENADRGMFPYNMQPGAAGFGEPGKRGADANAFQVAAIIWF